MLIEEVKLLSPVDRLCYWIKERESIRLNRSAKKSKPWTQDEILQGYRFCNVRRMDDKVSKWLDDNWYHPNFDHPSMLGAVALARFVNLPSSLEPVTKAIFGLVRPDWEWVKNILRVLKKNGPIFNGAYMVRGNDGMDKVECVVDYYVRPLIEETKPEINRFSMEKTHAAILEGYGMGSFMAGQIVADLRWAIKGDWTDKDTWAPLGPGSARGMNRIHERALKAPLKQDQFETELAELIAKAKKKLAPPITKRLEAMDWQSCLCEYDKYNRVLFGEGRPKSKYEGI